MRTKFLLESLKGTFLLGHRCRRKNNIKMDLKEIGSKCEHCNEPLGYIKGGGLLDYLSEY
jgi:hypothetical protein